MTMSVLFFLNLFFVPILFDIQLRAQVNSNIISELI